VTIYVCEVCHDVNAAHRLHCQSCGTTPRQYSILGVPSRYQDRVDSFPVQVIAAIGCERQTDRRGRKLYFRTVPVDYFVSV